MVKRFIIDVDTDSDHDLEAASYVTTVTRAQVSSTVMEDLMSVLNVSVLKEYEKHPNRHFILGHMFIALMIGAGFCSGLCVGFAMFLKSKCAQFDSVRYLVSVKVVILDLVMSYLKTLIHIFQAV